MKVLYRQTASDDILRQFRYYLLAAEAPEIALRFREAVRRTIQSLSQNPYVGPLWFLGPAVVHLRKGVDSFEQYHHICALSVWWLCIA